MWAYPAVSFEAIRVGLKRDLGVDYYDMAIADNYLNPKSLWLTANDTTIYAVTNVDLGKSGPVVVDMPPERSSESSKTTGRGPSATSDCPARMEAREASSSSCRQATKATFRRAGILCCKGR